MSKQVSEISIYYRDTFEPQNATWQIAICDVHDVIDVDELMPEFSTEVESVATASGVPYLNDPGNMSGSFELTVSRKCKDYAEACSAWASVMSSAITVPKRGWLEIDAYGRVFMFRAGITEVSPGLRQYFEIVTNWSFVITEAAVM